MSLETENPLSEPYRGLRMDLAKRWHIAIAQRGKDPVAERSLRLRGYTTYRPTLPTLKSDRWQRQYDGEESMFPRYIFVLPQATGWELLRTAPGILRGNRALLMFNNRFATIADSDPDFQLMQLTADEKRQEAAGGPPLPFQVGQSIRIESGPWAQFMGTVERVDSATRITCLIDMMRRKVRAYPDPRHVRAV